MKPEPAEPPPRSIDPESAESSLGYLEEQEWRRLHQQLKYSEGFWLGVLFTPAASAAAALRRRTRELLLSQERSFWLIAPRFPEDLREALHSLLGEESPKADCVWLEALVQDSLPRQDEGPWTAEWINFLLRLNERRDLLCRQLKGGLVLAAPVELKPRFRAAAPDLWSIRALVLEPMTFVSTADVRGVLKEADVLLSKGFSSRAASLALRVTEAFDRGDPSPEEKELLAKALMLLAQIQATEGDLPAAIEHLKRAVAICREIELEPIALAKRLLEFAEATGDSTQMRQSARETLDWIRASEKTRRPPQELRDMAATLDHVGKILEIQGPLKEAREAFEESLSLRRRLVSEYQGSAEALRDLSTTLHCLGAVRKRSGDVAGARAALEESLSLRQQLVTGHGESHERLSDLRASLDELVPFSQSLSKQLAAERFAQWRSQIEARLDRRELTPAFPDPWTRQLSEELEALYARRAELDRLGEDTSSLREEILDLKRRIREGGRLKPGDFLLDGRFKLLELIGRGGFAEIWKAYDSGRERALVAIKVLHGQFVDDRTRRGRFFRGARQMARLQHPGIVRIVEEECEDVGFFFFVMEYVAGGDFRQAVLEGRLTREERLRLVSEAGEVLAFAHQRGIVHRDVKPGNVLLGDDSRARLTDFDLVRADDTTGGTRTGMLGSVIYTAPEQMQRAQEAGAPADVFSLGMTAIFALYGADLSLGVLRDAPGFIAELDVGEPLRAVLRKAVAWEPEDRWASMPDFCAALDRAPNPPLHEAISFRAHGPEKAEIEWVDVPGGEYTLGAKVLGPVHTVVLSPFRIGRYPVTNDQYHLFLRANPDQPKPRFWNDTTFRQPQRPVVGVSWWEALAYCRWAGLELPTEAQWEAAARGTDQRRYPWGDEEPTLEKANFGENVGHPTPVGSYPSGTGPFGARDQAGNVWEWCQDAWIVEAYRGRDGTKDPVSTIGGEAGSRVVRGGSWADDVWSLSAAYRHGRRAVDRFRDLGFRVVSRAGPEP